ncbi:MAG TPA: PRC-barrel domain-containing protein [Candidatus Saccharimonadales bacterium]|nr:PRC-barrel domain-containing protein [Candidatus Saccharimonadales bacterium]
MLQLSSMLINRPVLSLRTGTEVATALEPIINPNNLKVEGFFCQDNRSREELVLVGQDVREMMPRGIIINDHDVLALPQDLVRLNEVLNTNFVLIGKQVTTVGGRKVGKVSDYSIDTDSMYVQKIYVTQSLLKSFTGSTLAIDRSQIIEITDKRIVVTDLTVKAASPARAVA